ncbi:hypothetical protein [Pseudalkalibacillus hwajinpoensis]|uniref:Lipoprotein n=1 Tax=Guptibacillus hwajinpoensis TaxID=208199 RepID=A0A4U1MMZ5_9BACL|nr:hypothetical protein [Pseudalkalibacillus hwajinpoensis]TKD72154.1 hypothetical protein FBF83_04970 [Pseudalkalibacillus hwajinpoensis]
MKLRNVGLVLLGSILLVGIMGCTANDEKQSNGATEPKANVEKDRTDEKDVRSNLVEMIANDEKIIGMLKSSGVIKENATQEEIREAVEDYLQTKAEQNQMREKLNKKKIEELKKEIQKDLQEEGS